MEISIFFKPSLIVLNDKYLYSLVWENKCNHNLMSKLVIKSSCNNECRAETPCDEHEEFFINTTKSSYVHKAEPGTRLTTLFVCTYKYLFLPSLDTLLR